MHILCKQHKNFWKGGNAEELNEEVVPSSNWISKSIVFILSVIIVLSHKTFTFFFRNVGK